MVTDGPPECAEPGNLTVLQGCATLQLSRGQNTLIDARDYPRLAVRKWHAHPTHGTYYAVRSFRTGRGKDRTTHTMRMHRAVLEASAGPCPPGMECRHLNGDSLDNRRGNLAWGTHSENAKDAVGHGTYKGIFRAGEPNLRNRGEGNGSARLKPSDIPGIHASFAAGETQSSIARRLGVSHTSIWKILEGKSWAHVGMPSAGVIRPKKTRICQAEIEDRIRAIYAEIGPMDPEPSSREIADRIGANRRIVALIRSGMIIRGRLTVPAAMRA